MSGCCCRLVNMAYLAVVGSKAVNGVAAIHSDIIKETIFKVRAELNTAVFQDVGCCSPCRIDYGDAAERWSQSHSF